MVTRMEVEQKQIMREDWTRFRKKAIFRGLWSKRVSKYPFVILVDCIIYTFVPGRNCTYFSFIFAVLF
jgi:hypothetical protein